MIFAHPISGIGQNLSSFALALMLIIFWPDSAEAHLELYHNVEVNLTETPDTGIVRLYFTIHAPELLVGFENAGADVFDAEWLRNRSDEEFKTLFEQGRTFVKEKFKFRIDSGMELDIREQLRFEKPDTIRSESYQSGVPVGCLLVSADLKLRLGSKQLEVRLAPDAGKRLLLVCTRKKAFPAVKDMDGGDTTILVLPEWKNTDLETLEVSSKAMATESKYLWPGVIALFVLLTVVVMRSRKTPTH